GRRIGGAIAFDDFAAVVDQNQVRGADLREVHAERVHPEPIGALRVAHGDMAGDAFAETEAAEQAEGAGEANFAMAALLGYGGESGRRREVFDASWGFDHKT